MPPGTLPSEADVRLNLPVLAFTLAACALSRHRSSAARPRGRRLAANTNDALKEGSRSSAGGRHRLRQALVVVEFALALTLLAGGGLAIHSLFKLANVDLGFQSRQLLTFSLPVPEDRLSGIDAGQHVLLVSCSSSCTRCPA